MNKSLAYDPEEARLFSDERNRETESLKGIRKSPTGKDDAMNEGGGAGVHIRKMDCIIKSM